MSIQNRNIVQIAVICNTLSPFHLAPDLFCSAGARLRRLVSLISSDVIIPRSLATGQGGGVSSLSLPYTPCNHNRQGSFRSHNINWPASFHPWHGGCHVVSPHHTHPPHYPGHASLIRCDLVWDAGAVSDGWRLIFPGQRHTGGRGNGSPRLLMSRWGSAQTQSWSANIYWYSIQSICTINKKHTRSLNPHYLSLIFSKTKSFTKDESVS